MKLKLFSRIGLTFISVVMVFSMLLSACGSKGSAPALSSAQIQSLLATGRQYYANGVAMETTLTDLMVIYQRKDSDFRTGLLELVGNDKACYKDVAATEAAVADAVKGNYAKGVTDPTAIQKAAIDVLVTQSVSGEQATTSCTGLNDKVADYVVSNRKDIGDAYLNMFTQATAYLKYTSEYPEIKLINDLLQVMPLQEIYTQLGQKGIGVTDFTWLPTQNLFMVVFNQKTCDYYRNGTFKEGLLPATLVKFTNHDAELMALYGATWNSDTGSCKLYKMAALDRMTTPIVSKATKEVINNNEDQSAFPTDVPPAVPTVKPASLKAPADGGNSLVSAKSAAMKRNVNVAVPTPTYVAGYLHVSR